MSQDRELATIECINRISKINKELKEKFVRGKYIANAFIELITEVKAQTDKICEMRQDFSSKFTVYNYCYENIQTAFMNYKKMMRINQKLLLKSGTLNKMK